MIKEIGRLDALETKKIEDYLEEIFGVLDDGKLQKAIDMLDDLCKTNNYFLREMVGKLLTKYKDQTKMENIANEMIESKTYGIRATAFFYLFNKHLNDPEKLMILLEENYDSVPWEVESIIYERWKKNPKMVKEMAPKWLNSEDEKKRMLAFHGLELIVESDTIFVLDFIGAAIDDPSMEVQKKMTHIILQVVKTKPAETYAYIREWIIAGSDKRVRAIMLTMKKILTLYSQKHQKDKTPDFMLLTKFILNNWKSEPHKRLAGIANKLHQTLKKETGKK